MLLSWGNTGGAGGISVPWSSTTGALLPPGFSLTRASTGRYYDSAGLLQTAAIDAARGTYRYNGSSWVFDGTIVEAAATNSLLHSRALGTAPWVGTGTAAAQNATGIDGAANTAWTLTDASAVAFDGYYTSGAITITANTSPTAFSVLVLKDSNNTTFPALRAVDVGTNISTDVVFNTSTGAFTAQQILGTGGGNVEDYGLWWKVTAYFNNNGAATGAQCIFFPAYTTGTTASAASTAAQRSVVVDQFDHRPNSTVTDSPIITAGVAVTRSADVLTAPTSGLLANAQGFAAIGYRTIASGSTAAQLSTWTGSGSMLVTTNATTAFIFDGTALAQVAATPQVPGEIEKIASTWLAGSHVQIACNGTVGAQSALAGNLSNGATIRIGNHVSGLSETISMVLQSLRLGTRAATDSELAGWTT